MILHSRVPRLQQRDALAEHPPDPDRKRTARVGVIGQGYVGLPLALVFRDAGFVFAEFDALLVATAHEDLKNPALYARSKLVVDTRNLIAPLFKGAPPVPTVKA